MSTEDFEGGSNGATLSSGNTIFSAFYLTPKFTNSPVRGGSLAFGGGAGFFGDGAGVVEYHADYGTAGGCGQVWAKSEANGSTETNGRGIILEGLGPPPGTSFDGGWTFGIFFKPSDDTLEVHYFDQVFAFTIDTAVVTGVTARGWLLHKLARLDSTHVRVTIYASNGTTVLFQDTFEVYNWFSGSHATHHHYGYSIAACSIAAGSSYGITVDDFSSPCVTAPRRKPHLRVVPRRDGYGTPTPGLYPPPRSTQGSNRLAGGTFS